MTISLDAELQRRVEERMRVGGYATPLDVLLAGLMFLEQHGDVGEFDEGELDELLAQGERSGEPIDADVVFAEVRALRNARSRNAG